MKNSSFTQVLFCGCFLVLSSCGRKNDSVPTKKLPATAPSTATQLPGEGEEKEDIDEIDREALENLVEHQKELVKQADTRFSESLERLAESNEKLFKACEATNSAYGLAIDLGTKDFITALQKHGDAVDKSLEGLISVFRTESLQSIGNAYGVKEELVDLRGTLEGELKVALHHLQNGNFTTTQALKNAAQEAAIQMRDRYESGLEKVARSRLLFWREINRAFIENLSEHL